MSFTKTREEFGFRKVLSVTTDLTGKSIYARPVRNMSNDEIEQQLKKQQNQNAPPLKH